MRYLPFILKNRDIFYYKTLEHHLHDCSSVLDVGCGEYSPLGRVRKTFQTEGVDIFDQSIKRSKKKKIHDKYTNLDIRAIESNYKSKNFDAVIALDVIEHFPKKQANKLIKAMEKIAKKKVILFTPNGFYPQDEIFGNPYQIHHSGWSKEDLLEMGYKVFGLRGLKYLRGDYASIKYKPWIVWAVLAFFSEPLLYRMPNLSYHLFAVKEMKNAKI